MTLKERVQDLFNRFNVDLAVEARTEMAEATLENGTVIYTDAEGFDEGAEAYIINDEGEQIALPPGDYELADGAILSIVEGGKIGSVTPAEAKGGEGKGAKKGVSPKGVSKPEAPAAKAPADGGTKDGGTTTPTKDPAPIKKSAQTPTEMEETKEEFVDSPVTRAMVEEMIREAIANMMGDQEEEMMNPEEEDKEEMSAVDPEASSEAPAPVEEPKKESKKAAKETKPEKEELSAVKEELEALKMELAEVQKQAASRGVQRMAPSQPAEPLDLTNMTTAERVRALANKFSK